MPDPVGRQLLGEERLHLLSVGIGFGGVGRLHGPTYSPVRRGYPAVGRCQASSTGPLAPSPTWRCASAPDGCAMMGDGCRGHERADCDRLPAPRTRIAARCAEPAALLELRVERLEERRRRTPTARRRRARSRSTSSIAAIDAHARAIMMPVRSTIAGGVRRSSRPVLASMPRAPAYIVRQPTAPHAHVHAVGFDDDVTELAEVAGQALEQTTVGDERAVDVVAEHHRREVLLGCRRAQRRRRATSRRARAPGRACRSRPGAR